MKYWRVVLLSCVLLTVTIALSGCGAGAKYVLVAGKPGMTDSEYVSARDYCITMTDGASYSQKFRIYARTSGSTGRTPNTCRLSVCCMHGVERLCLSELQKAFQSIPESSLKSGSN